MIRILLAMGAALVLAAPAQAFTINYNASSVASTLAGKSVTVECAKTYKEWAAYPDVLFVTNATHQDPSSIAGMAFIPEGRAILNPAACDFSPSNAGFAALVLTHETIHLTGIYDERVTECLAGKNVWRTIMLLGYKGKAAKAIYAKAMSAHNDMLGVKGYDWRGAC